MKWLRIPLLVMLTIWLAVPGPAWGQAPQGLESLTPEERARVQENLERWKQLPPKERERIRENLRRYRELPPEERQRLREELRGRQERGEARPGTDNDGSAPHPPRRLPPAR